jgi:hypothetical protein
MAERLVVLDATVRTALTGYSHRDLPGMWQRRSEV